MAQRCSPFVRYIAVLTAVVLIGPGNASSNASDETIVSLDLCTDWMLLHYARADQVVTFSPFLYRYPRPASPAGLPTHDGSLEQILALKPEHIITGEFNAVQKRERLQQLGFKVSVLRNPQRLGEVAQYIDRFRQLLHLPRIEEPSEPQPVSSETIDPSFSMLLLGANGIGVGRNTLEHDIMVAAGWTNYVEQSGHRPLQLETLVQRPPHTIVVTRHGDQSLATRFARHPALRGALGPGRWKSAADWRWQCPGPWSFDLIEQLVAWKRP